MWQIFPNYSEPMYCFQGFTIVARKFGDHFFEKKQPVIAERQTFFPKAIAKFKCQAFPKGADPLLKNSFPQFSKALDQERLHFTLAGLFSGFTIAASCARAAPGSPEEEQAFPKSNCQIQTPSFSQRSQSLIKPLLRNSFSKALDQDGLHFTLIGLFAGLTIAASCARAAPGSPKEKQAFSKSNCQIQTPSL